MESNVCLFAECLIIISVMVLAVCTFHVIHTIWRTLWRRR